MGYSPAGQLVLFQIDRKHHENQENLNELPRFCQQNNHEIICKRRSI
jgi:hypothetical protein